MNPEEIYSVFFEALRNNEGITGKLSIDGKKKKVFLLKKNHFNKKYVLDLETLSIFQVHNFLGIITSTKVLDINGISESNKDKLQEELEKLSKKFSEDMKSTFLERLKLRKLELNKREIKPRELRPKFKPRKPIVRRSIAK